MKIYAIQSHTHSALNNKPAQNTNRQNVHFGFGEDYGNDDFLRDSDHSSGGNIFEYIGLIIAFPIALVQDYLSERRAERRSEREFGQIEPEEIDDEE